MSDHFEKVIELIDQANACDINSDTDELGNSVAKELLYSRRMTESLTAFKPDASTHLKIAARAQHIERWTSLRSDYPEGRAGYMKWRKDLGAFHAQRTAELMAQASFPEEDIERVKYLVQKKGIKRDDECQALEDVICLVFLEHYLDSFAKKHSEEKLISIIQKTWAKMSESGHKAALGLSYNDEMLALIQKALSGE